MRMAAARPMPISLKSMIGIVAKTAKVTTMTTAALVTTPAVCLIPWATACSFESPRP